jgi:fumarate hydratase class II
MRISVAKQSADTLCPALVHFEIELAKKEAKFKDVTMVGRTHLMDAIPMKAGAVFSAYRSQIGAAKAAITDALCDVHKLPLGGTALGSGANAFAYFGPQTILRLASLYQLPFVQSENLYASVSSEDGLLRYSSALKQLATVLYKIANDFRLLGSGPMCGINEWLMPNNEPGSSIMPGKVNPTQCEALSMVCLQVFGNELTVSLAAANGQLQLNTYRPVIIYNILESIELLSSAMNSFAEHCIKRLEMNEARIQANVQNNLSVITLLAPSIGYDVAAKIAQTAHKKQISLGGAAEALGLYSKREFESLLAEHTH